MLFNLRQLMQLESERVEAEEAAVRERAASLQREQQAAERARAQEEGRQVREALRLEREREQLLLREQLRAAADERIRRESLEVERAREVSAIDARMRRSRAMIAAAGVAFTLIGGAAVHAWLSAPRIVQSEARRPAPAQPVVRAEQDSELARLREQLATLLASKQAQPQPTAAPPAPAPRRPSLLKHSHASSRPPRLDPENDPLGPIDTVDRDPLKGL